MIRKNNINKNFFLALVLFGLVHTSVVFSEETETTDIVVSEEISVLNDLDQEVAVLEESTGDQQDVVVTVTDEVSEQEITVDLLEINEPVVVDLYTEETASTTDEVIQEDVIPEEPVIEIEDNATSTEVAGQVLINEESTVVSNLIEIETDESIISADLNVLATTTSTIDGDVLDDLLESSTSSTSTLVSEQEIFSEEAQTEELSEELEEEQSEQDEGIEDEFEDDELPELTAEDIARQLEYIQSLPRIPAETYVSKKNEFSNEEFKGCELTVGKVKSKKTSDDDTITLTTRNKNVEVEVGSTPEGIHVNLINEEQKGNSSVLTFEVAKNPLAQQGIFSIPMIIEESKTKDVSLCSLVIINN